CLIVQFWAPVSRSYYGAMSGEPPVLPRVDPEVEQSRESAARLLNALSQRLRQHRALIRAARGIGRAASHVPVRSLFTKSTMGVSIAVAAGFVVGCGLGRRFYR